MSLLGWLLDLEERVIIKFWLETDLRLLERISLEKPRRSFWLGFSSSRFMANSYLPEPGRYGRKIFTLFGFLLQLILILSGCHLPILNYLLSFQRGDIKKLNIDRSFTLVSIGIKITDVRETIGVKCRIIRVGRE